MSAVDSTHELDCGRELLHRSTEARNEGKRIPTVTIEELLARPKYPVLVKGKPLLEYGSSAGNRLQDIRDRI